VTTAAERSCLGALHQEWPGSPGPATWDGHPRCQTVAWVDFGRGGRRWRCGPRGQRSVRADGLLS
jgi:hypothetical protein